MTTNYEQLPTILAYTQEELGVIAGGGVMGFGGVIIHEPVQHEFSRISRDIEDDISPKAAAFNYSEVSTITSSGLLVWTNCFLERAPKGRQDIRTTGKLRLELFDSEDTRSFLDSYLENGIFDRLGIKLVDYL